MRGPRRAPRGVAIALDESPNCMQARLGDRSAGASGSRLSSSMAAPDRSTGTAPNPRRRLQFTRRGRDPSLQPRELCKSQPYAPLYRAELAPQGAAKMNRGAGQPRSGYTGRLRFSSPLQQIQDQLAKAHHRGAEAAEMQHIRRVKPRDRSHDRGAAAELAEAFVINRRTWCRRPSARITSNPGARVTRSGDLRQGAEPGRDAVVDRRAWRDAGACDGELPVDAPGADFEHRVETGIHGVEQPFSAPSRAFTA